MENVDARRLFGTSPTVTGGGGGGGCCRLSSTPVARPGPGRVALTLLVSPPPVRSSYGAACEDKETNAGHGSTCAGASCAVDIGSSVCVRGMCVRCTGDSDHPSGSVPSLRSWRRCSVVLCSGLHPLTGTEDVLVIHYIRITFKDGYD